MSPHRKMACGDVGGRVTDCTGSSVAAEWLDPEGDDGAPIPVSQQAAALEPTKPGGCGHCKWPSACRVGDEKI